MDVERQYYITQAKERQTFKEEVYKLSEYEQITKNKSNDYADWWIREKGDRALKQVENYSCNVSKNDPCYLNVFNKSNRKVEHWMIKDVINIIAKDDYLPSNKFDQTRFWKDCYISSSIYKFLYCHYHEFSSVS